MSEKKRERERERERSTKQSQVIHFKKNMNKVEIIEVSNHNDKAIINFNQVVKNLIFFCL